MSILNTLKKITPQPIKGIIRPIYHLFINKYDGELAFWQSRFEIDNGQFTNAHYRHLMLAMAEEDDDKFVEGKIVADFGCGPRGSLTWATSAQLRIGIYVLADRYADEFFSNIISHRMIYLKSTEKAIPLPSDFVDIMFTINAIDHVENFPIMCNEILRVLKPGGKFIGSFNLEEPASLMEPQKLSEKVIQDNLLNQLEVQSYRITEKGPADDPYAPFFSGSLFYRPDREGYLWVKARKSN
jgi:ubiquinone/menaquinone biosynthesis C-methylase UbiE